MNGRIRPGSPFQQGCVLQQGDQTRIWGYAAIAEKIVVEIQKQTKEYLTDVYGRFEGLLPHLAPGGPFNLSISGEVSGSLVISDVYVGEVVICAGQSNAGLPMSRVREQYPEEFHQGGTPDVHIYKVEEKYEFHEPLLFHEAARWISCTVDQLSDLSALSYFTGKKLWEEKGVPIGVINLSIGGTPVESWTSAEGLSDWPECLAYRRQYEDDQWLAQYMEGKKGQEADWQAELVRLEKEPPRGSGCLKIPGYLSEAGLSDFCGCLWLYKTFHMPEDFDGRPGLLRFGTLTDNDEIYINGKKIGETGYSYPPRRYPIPSGLIHAGENEVQIRLVVRDGAGRATYGKPYDIIWEDACGRIPDDNRVRIERASDTITPVRKKEVPEKLLPVSLKGDWKYEIRALSSSAPEQEFLIRKPTVLFQGMTAPCIPYTVQGVIWYQGESNDQNPEPYRELLPAMIRDWRNKWGQEHLPFVIIQLPNCGVDTAPGEAWPKIREAQRQAGKLEDTAVITTLDLGEDNDLHPLRKKELSERAVLALDALAYGEKKPYQGPVPERVAWTDGGVEIVFGTAEVNTAVTSTIISTVEGLRHRFELDSTNWDNCKREITEKSSLSGKENIDYAFEKGHLQLTHGTEIPDGLFEWLDGEGKIHPAVATLCPAEKKVILSIGNEIPVAIRYAYQAAPGSVLLTDTTKIPASPFVEPVQEGSQNE